MMTRGKLGFAVFALGAATACSPMERPVEDTSSSGSGGSGGGTASASSGSGGTMGTGGATTSTSTSGSGGTGGVPCSDGLVGCPCLPGNKCNAGATCINGQCEAGCCSGYQDVGGQCIFGGGPSDPGFMAPGSWTQVGLALVEPTGPGVDPGRAFLDEKATCDSGAGVTQTFATPQLSCAEPLMLNVQAMLACNGLCFDNVQLGVGINGGWNGVPLNDGAGFEPVQLCLGAAVLGGSSSLFLGPLAPPKSSCPSPFPGQGYSLAIDAASFSVDTSGACPPFGTVPNGDFEAGAKGWTLLANGATADITPGAGNGGTPAGHLATTKFCTDPSIRGVVSVPTSAMVPNPALHIWSSGSAGNVLAIQLGGVGVTYLGGTGSPREMNLCLPRWALGTVQPIVLYFGDQYAGQTCANPNPRDFVFDDLSFVSEPACEDGAYFFDGGFEQASLATAAAPFWTLQQLKGAVGATASLKVDAASAHTGNVSVELRATQPCVSAGLSGVVTVPPPTAQGGPALKFFYKTSFQVAHASLAVKMAAQTSTASFPVTSSYKEVTVCLDPALAGRPDVISFNMNSGSGTCATAYAAETFSIDDVALTNDPTCPSM